MEVYLDAHMDRLTVINGDMAMHNVSAKYTVDPELVDAITQARATTMRAELALLRSIRPQIESDADEERHHKRAGISAQQLLGTLDRLELRVVAVDAVI